MAAEVALAIAQLLCCNGRTLLRRGRVPPGDATSWIYLSDISIRELEEEQCKPLVSINLKRRLATKLLYLVALKSQIETASASVIVGHGFQQAPRVKWEDVQSAFQFRIRTGSTVSYTHLTLPTNREV